MSEQSKANLLKKARAKFGSYRLVTKLLEANPESALVDSYSATKRCNNRLFQSGKRLTSKYCKNRWCFVCNRVRTAKLISGYLPVLEDKRIFSDPFFVTLTKVTVTAPELDSSIELMHRTCRNIINGAKGRAREITGIRKAECTIRPNGHYHYHFHFIIEGRDNARWLKREWLKRMGSKATPTPQHIRPANKKSLKELFKYFTKLTVKTKDENGKLAGKSMIEPERMDVIFNAMRGRRVYQTFGGVQALTEDIEDIQVQEYDFLTGEDQVWTYKGFDWENELGECLTGYIPSQKFIDFFNDEKQVKESEQLELFIQDTTRSATGSVAVQPARNRVDP